MATGPPGDIGTQQVRSARHACGTGSASSASRTVSSWAANSSSSAIRSANLRMLLCDQPTDALLGGAAVGAVPDRDQVGDLLGSSGPYAARG